MPRLSLALSLLPALVIAGTAATASAAAPADPENRVHRRFRFHIDTDAVGWTRGRSFLPADAPDGAPTTKIDNVGLGFARPLQGDKPVAGTDPILGTIGTSMFGLGLGYGITPYLILGARVGLAFDRTTSPSDSPFKQSNNFFSTVFTPYLEILPLPRGRILPFILVRSGLSAVTFGDRSRGSEGPIEVNTLDRFSLLGPTVGVGGGAHFLITDYFSIDASLMFDYRWYFAKSLTKDKIAGTSVSGDWERQWQSFTLGAVLGFSVWFGGGGT
ncbi:hypothetical protein [Nannocystis sp.]|uniref:hypothetical protein n=1 Tax=Nannocystis sp. TaxID=1962667 RepID=UPI0025D21033|nr:hypothetical protein [Nannocystis sp.]MBK7826268.1 hypothetical protein [Nannocystis sp.]